MAADNNARRKLVQFMNRRVLDPVLRVSERKYSETNRKALERLKEKTETQKHRYANYKTAGEVRQRFQDDLTSQPAKRVHADLRRLNLPAQPDFKNEFLALADRLGVTKGEKSHRKHRAHAPHPWHKKKPEDKEKAWRELKALARKPVKVTERRNGHSRNTRQRDTSGKFKTQGLGRNKVQRDAGSSRPRNAGPELNIRRRQR
jgi:hypothetical protein